MSHEAAIIKNLKNLKSKKDNKKFLLALRSKLVAHIAANPIKNERKQHFLSMPLISFASIQSFVQAFPLAASLIVIITLLASTTGITLASKNSLPGHALYPVKILAENIRSSIAASPVSKARLETEFANERMTEIKKIITEENPNTENLDAAINRLEEHTSKVSDIIEEEEEKGKDVSELAKNINSTLDANQENLNEAFKIEKNNLTGKEKNLKTKITEAKKNSDVQSAQILTDRLKEVNQQKRELEKRKNDSEKILEENNMKISSKMKPDEQKAENKKRTEKIIQKLENGKQEILDNSQNDGTPVSPDIFSDFDPLLSQAKNSFTYEDYAKANEYAQKAKSQLSKIEKSIEENLNPEPKESEKNNDKKQYNKSRYEQKNSESEKSQNQIEEEKIQTKSETNLSGKEE